MNAQYQYRFLNWFSQSHMLPLLATVLVAMTCCRGARGEPVPARSLGDPWRDERSGNRLNELDRELFAPGDEKNTPQRAQPSVDDLQERLRRELGKAAIADDDHPLRAIAAQMRKSENLIRRNDPGSTTQAVQAQIIAELERLLQQARSAAQLQPSGGNPQQAASSRTPAGAAPPRPKGGSQPAEKPAATSTERNHAKGAKPSDPAQVRELMEKVWGTLPQHEREQVQQIPAEQFLPKYRPLIEEYFRRLSEEQGRRTETRDK